MHCVEDTDNMPMMKRVNGKWNGWGASQKCCFVLSDIGIALIQIESNSIPLTAFRFGKFGDKSLFAAQVTITPMCQVQFLVSWYPRY